MSVKSLRDALIVFKVKDYKRDSFRTRADLSMEDVQRRFVSLVTKNIRIGCKEISWNEVMVRLVEKHHFESLCPRLRSTCMMETYFKRLHDSTRKYCLCLEQHSFGITGHR